MTRNLKGKGQPGPLISWKSPIHWQINRRSHVLAIPRVIRNIRKLQKDSPFGPTVTLDRWNHPQTVELATNFTGQMNVHNEETVGPLERSIRVFATAQTS
jgi:hypothetical protein